MDVSLIVIREDGSRRVLPLAFGKTAIGRRNDCEIRIPLSEVSRHHSELHLREDGLFLRDLDSANGTFLNNHRVLQEEQLEAGDQILVGPVTFTVRIDGKPADDELVGSATDLSRYKKSGGRLGTSKHVYISDEEVDPIAALEALASSADQTAIQSELDEDH